VPSFSVVVPVFNSRPYLDDLVGALGALREPPGGFEVVFVDNRSTDGGFEQLTAACEGDQRMRVIRGQGIGPAAARNLGVAVAQGELIAFTDPDTLPDPDWLVAAAAVLERDESRALEGAVLAEDDATAGPLVRRIRNEDGGRYMTANMVYAKDLLDEIGGFDERFRPPPFLEDSDVAFRVLDAGVEIPFAPGVRVRHRNIPLSPRRELADQGRLQWMALLARKHPERYRRELRPKVQAFRPGDREFLLAIPATAMAWRLGAKARLLSLAGLALAARRVIRASGFADVPARGRAPWIAVALIAPVARAVHLARGWRRFGRLAV
jgi:GT2 family glycosyltransferase